MVTFRPEMNGERMMRSAERLAMPQLPVDEFVKSLEQLLAIDQAWVPEAGGEAALYLRPFMILPKSPWAFSQQMPTATLLSPPQ